MGLCLDLQNREYRQWMDLKEGNSFPLVLVDKSGNIRGYYKQERDKDIKRLGRDIDSLLKIS